MLGKLQATKDAMNIALIAGNLFAEDDESVWRLLSGEIIVPLPTYFTVGISALPPRIVERIEKDEEARCQDEFVVFWLTHVTDLPQPTLSG